MIGLVATVLLQIPFFKHMFAWMGCKPAGRYLSSFQPVASCDEPLLLLQAHDESLGHACTCCSAHPESTAQNEGVQMVAFSVKGSHQQAHYCLLKC